MIFYTLYRQATAKSSIDINSFTLSIMISAYLQAREERTVSHTNFYEKYPNLSKSIKAAVINKKSSIPDWFNSELKQALTSMLTIVYNKKSGFTEYWLGESIQEQEKTLSPTQIYEHEIYINGSKTDMGIPIERFKELFPDVDLDNTSDWVCSLNGKNIVSIEDHFVGSVADLKDQYNEAIMSADENLKGRLLKQLQLMDQYIDKIDIHKMNFTMTSGYISAAEKVNFLNQYVVEGKGNFYLEYKEDGELKYTFKPNSTTDKSIQVTVLKRIAFYLNNSGSISSGVSSSTEEGKERHEEIISTLQQKVNTINAQFDSYVKRNKKLLTQLDNKLNNERILHFRTTENDADIQVEGINCRRSNLI